MDSPRTSQLPAVAMTPSAGHPDHETDRTASPQQRTDNRAPESESSDNAAEAAPDRACQHQHDRSPDGITRAAWLRVRRAIAPNRWPARPRRRRPQGAHRKPHGPVEEGRTRRQVADHTASRVHGLVTGDVAGQPLIGARITVIRLHPIEGQMMRGDALRSD